MNKNRSISFPAVVDQIPEPSGAEQTVTVTNLFELLQFAELSPANDRPKALECNQDRFQFFMLKELYRAAAFYYRQMKKQNPAAEDRLNRALKGLAHSLSMTNQELVERFMEAVKDDGERFWFILSSLSDLPAGDTFGFENRLTRYLQQAVLLNDGFKSALQRSKAKSLSGPIQKAFLSASLAVKLELLAILQDRGELDPVWLATVQQNSEPDLKLAINRWLNS